MMQITRLYSKLLLKYPLLVQSFQTGTLMAAGDFASQIIVERKKLNGYEWIRTARFFCIGTFIVGPSLKIWYGILDRRIGNKGGFVAVKKMLADQCFFAPSFMLMFIIILGFSQKKGVEEIKHEIRKNYSDIMLANYSVWPAVQMCNFYFVPLQHQVLLVQTFALFWNTYLAWKTNR